jgi:hypothetical protein
MTSARFPYLNVHSTFGSAGAMPIMPFLIDNQDVRLDVVGLVDSGATINVMPYDVGIQLGADWSQLVSLPQLVGNLGNYPAKALFVDVTVANFSPALLCFAWTQDPAAIRILLGQMNFFAEFDVCFHRSRSYFEVQPKP